MSSFQNQKPSSSGASQKQTASARNNRADVNVDAEPSAAQTAEQKSLHETGSKQDKKADPENNDRSPLHQEQERRETTDQSLRKQYDALKSRHDDIRKQYNQLEDDMLRTKDERLRALAEMENLHRRHQRERVEIQKYSAAKVLREFLHVADSLQRALESSTTSSSQQMLRKLQEGLQLTWRSFTETLKQNGVTMLDPAGKPFDPNQQEAILQQESRTHAPGVVLQVVENGYLLFDRLLRPARVIVAKAPEDSKDSEKTPEA